MSSLTTPSSSSSSAAASSVLDLDAAKLTSPAALAAERARSEAAIAAASQARARFEDELQELKRKVVGHDDLLAQHSAEIARLDARVREAALRQSSESMFADGLAHFNANESQLLCYRYLTITLEALFVSCKAASGGFVDLGGAAGGSSALANSAKATRVCGAFLSLLPFGSVAKAAAELVASGLEQANAVRRDGIVSTLNKNYTMCEAKVIAVTVARAVTDAYAQQLNALVPPALMTDASQSSSSATKASRFMTFLQKTFSVGGALVGAYVDGDGLSGVVSAAKSAVQSGVEQSIVSHIACKSGALVGSASEGVTPFAQVLAEALFLVVMTEIEQARANESVADLAARLTTAALSIKHDESSSASASDGAMSGARRLLKAMFRKGLRAAKGSGSPMSLSVFVGRDEATFREVGIFELLSQCGVETPGGVRYTAPFCNTALCGYVVADDRIAGNRGLRIVAATPQIIVQPASGGGGGGRGGGLNAIEAAKVMAQTMLGHSAAAAVAATRRAPPSPTPTAPAVRAPTHLAAAQKQYGSISAALGDGEFAGKRWSGLFRRSSLYNLTGRRRRSGSWAMRVTTLPRARSHQPALARSSCVAAHRRPATMC